MPLLKKLILWGSRNKRIAYKLPKYNFFKKSLATYMPGETSKDAFNAARYLMKNNIRSTFNILGENVNSLEQSRDFTKQYLELQDDIKKEGLDIEIALKLTQIGFDISIEETYNNFIQIIKKAKSLNQFIWIDMESNKYTQATIDFYLKVKEQYTNCGISLQSSLYRAEKDLSTLLPYKPNIRLVKGAYEESTSIAFTSSRLINKSYHKLAQILLREIKKNNIKVAFATHDFELLEKISNRAEWTGYERNNVEFQMFYGVYPEEQKLLADSGYSIRVLINYGTEWFPWYMRRLAERHLGIWELYNYFFRKKKG